MYCSSDESDEYHTPLPEIINSAEITDENVLQLKSKARYITTYENFITWKNERKMTSFSEDVLISYVDEISKKYKPSSLWAIYSMLKSTLKSKHNVNIEDYVKLTSFLRKQSAGFVGKKSKVLTMENVEKFIDEAPDDKYLVTKVALILGVTGGLRRQELSDITTNDIENHGELFVVKVPNTKTKIPRAFIVQGKYYNIMKRYQALRSKKGSSNRFFQHFRNGKCTGQVIGKNRFGNMPKEIAEYLGLPDTDQYTGHSFRRTSTTLNGSDTLTLKQLGGWNSNDITEENIDDSHNSKEIGNKTDSTLKSCSKVKMKPEASTSSNLEKEPQTSSFYVEVERAEPDSSESSKTDRDRDPLNKVPLEQCRFCGKFTKDYADVADKPYLSGNKTVLAVNSLNVNLDFKNETLPNMVCLDCDEKLQDMLDFVKLVKFAQDTLINIAEDARPIETVIVRTECKSPTPDDKDDKDETRNKKDDMNSMVVCEDKTATRKRKIDEIDTTKKKPKVKLSARPELMIEIKTEFVRERETVNSEFTTDIKQETVEKDDASSINSDLVIDIKEEPIARYKAVTNEISDTGTESKVTEVELATRALIDEMGDDNS